MKKLLLSAALLALLSSPTAAEDLDGSQKKLDTDGDGAVSKAEFMAQQEVRFKEIDANGDGAIDRSEFKTAHEKMNNRRKAYLGNRKERREADSE